MPARHRLAAIPLDGGTYGEEVSGAVSAGEQPLARALRSIATMLGAPYAQIAGTSPDGPITIDEHAFMELVRTHRLAAYLGPRADLLDLTPLEVRQLTDAWKQANIQGELQAMSTVRVCTELEAAGIPVVAYKGVGLSWLTTGSTGGRGGGDVDVLVPADRAADAIEALVGVGGVVLAPGFPRPGDRLWKSFTRLYNEFPVQFGPVEVDLHWRLDSVPEVLPIPFRDLQARGACVPVSGSSFRTLGTQDALLVAALHGTKEQWQTLRRVIDFVLLARAVSDWDALVASADAYGGRPALNLGLCFASRLAPELRPPAEALCRSSDVRRADACWAMLARSGGRSRRPTRTAVLATLRWQMRTMPSARARWHLLERSLVYFKDMERLKLPPSMLAGYALLRPFMSLLPDPVDGRPRQTHR